MSEGGPAPAPLDLRCRPGRRIGGRDPQRARMAGPRRSRHAPRGPTRRRAGVFASRLRPAVLRGGAPVDPSMGDNRPASRTPSRRPHAPPPAPPRRAGDRVSARRGARPPATGSGPPDACTSRCPTRGCRSSGTTPVGAPLPPATSPGCRGTAWRGGRTPQHPSSRGLATLIGSAPPPGHSRRLVGNIATMRRATEASGRCRRRRDRLAPPRSVPRGVVGSPADPRAQADLHRRPVHAVAQSSRTGHDDRWTSSASPD